MMGSAHARGGTRTWRHCKPKQPNDEGVGRRLQGPVAAPALATRPQLVLREGVEEVVYATVLDELLVVASVVLEEHEVRGPQVAEEVGGLEVGIPDALQGERLLLELEGEGGSLE